MADLAGESARYVRNPSGLPASSNCTGGWAGGVNAKLAAPSVWSVSGASAGRIVFVRATLTSL